MVDGLADGDARALLDSVVTGPLDERVRDRIVAETRGNPLALLELAARADAGELAGGFGLPGARGPCRPDRGEFPAAVRGLPAATRLLLLVAAAEPTGDPVLLWRAAGQLGRRGSRPRRRRPRPGSSSSAGRCGSAIRSPGPRSTGRPRRGSASAPTAPLRRPPTRTPIPIAAPGTARTRHRTATRTSRAELERSAGRARARGGLAAAAAFCERAAELTPDPARRAQRALAAAQAKHQAGAPDAALRLLAMAQAGPLDELGRARAGLLRAQLAAVDGRGRDAPPLLLKAARRLEPLDAGLAREAYRDAFGAALTAGRLATGGGMLEVAEAARGAATGAGAARSRRPAAGRPGGADHRGACRRRAGDEAGAERLPHGNVRAEEALRWLPARVPHGP